MTKLPDILVEFYRSFNTNDTSHLDRILALNCVNHPNDPGQPPNSEGLKGGIADLHESFENFNLKIRQVIYQDDNIAVHLQMSGTQVKAFAGIDPQNVPVKFYGFDRHLLNKEHTQILETWHFEDFSNLAKNN